MSVCNGPSCPGTKSYKSGWPQTHRNTFASASQVLGLKESATTAQLLLNILLLET